MLENRFAALGRWSEGYLVWAIELCRLLLGVLGYDRHPKKELRVWL